MSNKMSDLHRKIQTSRLPPMPPKFPSRGGIGAKKRGPIKRDYTPVSWDHYFKTVQDVKLDDSNTFRVYQNGTEGPVCFFLHGGGFSALSWALLADIMSGLVECRCVAVDMRGHGDTQTEDEKDLSAQQLSSDIGNVISSLYGNEAPPIILIGHSMGGAIAVHSVFNGLVPSVIGLVIIDVVEGTALDALSSMQSFLLTRPRTFKSVEYAVEWCVRSGQVRNLESAKVSMVGQVKRLSSNQTTSSDMAADSDQLPVTYGNVIQEEEEDTNQPNSQSSQQTDTRNQTPETDSNFKSPGQPAASHQYTWRVNLSETEKYWRGWFQGLSSMFLSCNVPKMLLLAGVDRLDRDLTVGQMQGKFQMQVLPQCGHAVHEDVPEKVADVLATFLVRNKFAQSKDNFERTFPSC